MVIDNIRLLEKSGGEPGDYRAKEGIRNARLQRRRTDHQR